MLVAEQYRNCVAFLCLPGAVARPVGSGFFIVVPDSPTEGDLYLVTARHVVENARPLGPLQLRLNPRSGRAAEYVELDPKEWAVSHDADVVAMRMDATLHESFDFDFLRLTQVANAEVLVEQHVGPGDEVFFSGLFTSFSGVERAEPIIRFGSVSMMRREPVPIKNADGSTQRVEAFLVEARSWGGQSGSPAFIYFPATRYPGYLTLPNTYSGADGGLVVPDGVMPQLLGLVSGHFDLRADVAVSEDIGATAEVPLNSGIAIVTPAQKRPFSTNLG